MSCYRIIKDLLTGAVLLLIWLVTWPLVALRSSTLSGQCWRCLCMLLKHGQFSRFVRAMLEWRLSNYGEAATQLEAIITVLEDRVTASTRGSTTGVLLSDLYTLLVRLYLYRGHIESALLIILRARKVLRIDRLPALPELDIKTAHLIRAGIAAGKLLDGSSLATLVVKTTTYTHNNARAKRQPKQGHTAASKRTNVIPFPSCDPN